jgi:divinyl chlorophyllide a 8-vinyl-reductase
MSSRRRRPMHRRRRLMTKSPSDPGNNHSIRRVLLAGATGYIGRAVAAALVADGRSVVAPVRSASDSVAGCDTVVTELDEAALGTALAAYDFDAVISCIASRSGAPDDAWRVDHDANQALLKVASATGARRFILLSAICVQKPRLAFQHAKLAFEQTLMQSGMPYTIVRPTAYFKSLSGQIARVKAGKPYLMFGDGTQTACKPIGEADLADFLVTCLDRADTRNRILPIGGPGPAISARAQGELLFDLTGMTPRFRQVPPAMFEWIARALTPLGRLSRAVAAKAEFARIAHYYATESMLVWDAQRERYDADQTPSTGTTTLRDHYERVLQEGMTGQEAGDHKLF